MTYSWRVEFDSVDNSRLGSFDDSIRSQAWMKVERHQESHIRSKVREFCMVRESHRHGCYGRLKIRHHIDCITSTFSD